MLKPSNGLESAGVKIIHNITDFHNYQISIEKLKNQLSNRDIDQEKIEIIAEEYLDGEKCSVDYFVNQEGRICGVGGVVFVT